MLLIKYCFADVVIIFEPHYLAVRGLGVDKGVEPMQYRREDVREGAPHGRTPGAFRRIRGQ